MTLPTATQLGPYEILEPLGAGGMGEVYRARDGRLNRDVAIKVLPSALSQDVDRLRRFEQEAQAAGMLNHPNILTIYDIGIYEGSPYIVSELLEGETLRERISQGALPVRKAVDYSVQITRGLAAAHDKEIVHRDLKPDNIFLTRDGRVKILDFGLAKLKPPRSAPGMDTQSPTRLPQTDPGVVLGTVGYMSPEQVRGREADHRADIFAFGAILYEMLAGRRAFEGDSTIETMNAILKEDPPDLPESNRAFPAALGGVVRHCLEKSPEERFQSARDVGFYLDGLSGLSGPTSSIPVTGWAGARNRERFVWLAVIALLLTATVALAIVYFKSAPTEVRAVRSLILPPENSSFNITGTNAGFIAVSPDGRRLAFVARTSDGKTLLWIRALDSLSAQPLAGTEGALYPFWSPNSDFLGFFANGALKKIQATGGPALTLADAPRPAGGTWNSDGTIVFAPNFGGTGLYRVSASGGTASIVTKRNEMRSEGSHRWPCFLPDGRHFLYVDKANRGTDPSDGTINIASLDSKESKLLLHTSSNVAYAQGYLLFVREATLMAQPFDAERLEMTGNGIPIAEQILYEPAYARGVFSVSDSGVLVYQTGSIWGGGSHLTWFDRKGKPLGVLGDFARYSNPHLSPDGKRVAVNLRVEVGKVDVWLFEVARGLPTRFIFDPAEERSIAWSRDGSRIAFASNRTGHFDLYQKTTSGAGTEELLFASREEKIPTSYSSDGRFLLFNSSDAKTASDLWVLPLSGDRKPFPFLRTEISESGGQFSPDGRWIAYSSDDSRSSEVYLAPFPGPGGKRQISTSGGSAPRWRSDGKEIFYLAPGDKLMAAELNVNGSTLEVGALLPLFEVRRGGPGSVYDVAPDAQRFLINTAVEQKASSAITLVINWTADLKR